MRRHKRIKQEADLDITSFMNLMIVLVPVLLLNMVFAQTTVLDLKLPLGDTPPGAVNPEDISVEVTIRPENMQVIVAAGGASTLAGTVARVNNQYDYKALTGILKEVKKSLENSGVEKRDVVLLSAPDINYQVLVATMDAARHFDTVVAASVVKADLFPEVSLGDAPELVADGQPEGQDVAEESL